MDNSTKYPTVNYQELTLKDVLLGIFNYVQHFWRRKWWILGVSLVFAAIFVYRATLVPDTYVAKLTFMLNADEAATNSGLGSLLGQVGLSSGGSEYNLGKIVELSQSRLIVQTALLDTIEVDGRRDRMAHHIIDLCGFKEIWKEEERTGWPEIRFHHHDVDSLGLRQSRVLQYLHRVVVGSNSRVGYTTVTIDVPVGILTLRGETIHEELTYAMTRKLYKVLSDYYIQQSIKGPRQTVRELRIKSDSLLNELRSVEYQLAKAEDVGRGIFQRQGQLAKDRLRRQTTVLGTMYAEVLRNLQTADFALKNITPFFTVIDRPILPLSTSQENLVLRGVMGAILGGLLTIVYLTISKLIRDTLRGDDV